MNTETLLLWLILLDIRLYDLHRMWHWPCRTQRFFSSFPNTRVFDVPGICSLWQWPFCTLRVTSNSNFFRQKLQIYEVVLLIWFWMAIVITSSCILYSLLYNLSYNDIFSHLMTSAISSKRCNKTFQLMLLCFSLDAAVLCWINFIYSYQQCLPSCLNKTQIWSSAKSYALKV